MAVKGVIVINEPLIISADIAEKELFCTWEQDKEIISELLSPEGINMLFLKGLIVPPNRFRPQSKGISTHTYLHIQSASLVKIFTINERIKEKNHKKEKIIDDLQEIQHAINMYMDSSN